MTLPDVAARDFTMIFLKIYSIANLMHSSIRTISLLSVLATRWSVCVFKVQITLSGLGAAQTNALPTRLPGYVSALGTYC